jgi:hypothetical protein
MIKSIWEKIKLAFERKPAGDVQYPSYGGDTLTEGVYKIEPPIVVTKPKRVRKPKNESA